MNEYKGWYGGVFEEFGAEMDTYRAGTQVPWAVGEYGAGNNPHTHSDNPMQTTQTGSGGARHDEEYANLFHEAYLEQIQARPWLLYTAVWALYDFASDNRNEGGTPHLNDKRSGNPRPADQKGRLLSLSSCVVRGSCLLHHQPPVLPEGDGFHPDESLFKLRDPHPLSQRGGGSDHGCPHQVRLCMGV
ncbi:hypothetical protein [Anaeromassilibacillus sp. SJQ-1]|uniref:hypothetical protein n=1 Tax=Anaeromassilibacillus sp. SJQ-1 TaxID=3375419 RepID=UPI003989404E